MKLEQIVTGIQHIGIPTENIEKTIAFYTSLGFQVSLHTEIKTTHSQVVFLNLKDLTVEAYEEHDLESKSGAINHIALDVSDIEAAFQTIKEGGYSLVDSEIHFLPFWENGIRYFTIEGPNHERIEFNQKL